MAFQPIQLKVSKIVQETPDVKTYRLALEHPLPSAFLPGQFIVLHFEIFDKAKGRLRKKNRAFSISSSPDSRDYWEVTVRKTGFVSSYMDETLKVGDRVIVKSLGGEFYFQEAGAKELVLLAGGTGIAPLMSMIRYVIDRHLPTKLTLIYSCRSLEDIIFREELERISVTQPNIQCVFTMTRSVDDSWRGHRGRISRELLEEYISNFKALFYLCGPDAMVQSGLSHLKEMGVNEDRIRLEKWG